MSLPTVVRQPDLDRLLLLKRWRSARLITQGEYLELVALESGR